MALRILVDRGSRLGVDAGAVCQQPGWLRLRRRLLGLPSGLARHALRAGVLYKSCLYPTRLLLLADRRGERGAVDDPPVGQAGVCPLLLRRLLRPAIRE